MIGMQCLNRWLVWKIIFGILAPRRLTLKNTTNRQDVKMQKLKDHSASASSSRSR
jgi:hypothetical protein